MSPNGSGAALRRCTGLDRDSFAEAYWSRQPLLSQHPDGFTDLLSAADIDELVALRGLRTPFFRVVKAGEPAARATRSAAAGNRSISDLADPDAVRDLYAEGSTLVLQSLHRLHPPLVRFCRELAAELGHATQCNAYVTPPGSQGFAAHHDTHDVFVLQVDGFKRWNVYEPVLALPLSTQPSSALGADAPLVADGAAPVLSVVLGPGDALYLPRGYIHAAETNADRSIHLTVGVLAATAYDVLRDVLALAGEQPEFRRSLPLGSAADQLAVVEQLVSQASAWLAELPVEQLHDAVRPRLARTHAPEPLGLLAAEDAVRQLDKNTLVRPRLGPAAAIGPGEPGRVVLRVVDRELSLPEYVSGALEALLYGECRVSELDLPVDDAVVLVRRLMKEGILVGAPPT